MNVWIKCWNKEFGEPDRFYRVKLIKLERSKKCASGTAAIIAPIKGKAKPAFFGPGERIAKVDASYLMDTYFLGNTLVVGSENGDRL